MGAGDDVDPTAESAAEANAAPASPALKPSRANAATIVRCIHILLEAARAERQRAGIAV
jgi:hypothetical protein